MCFSEHAVKWFATMRIARRTDLECIGQSHALEITNTRVAFHRSNVPLRRRLEMYQQTNMNETLASQGDAINELFAQRHKASLRTTSSIFRPMEDSDDAVSTAYCAKNATCGPKGGFMALGK